MRALLSICLLAAWLPAFAQWLPSKPVTLLGISAGGGMDYVLRSYQPELSKRWKQPAVIDPRPGAGGLIAAVALARAEPDGHTMLIHTDSILVYQYFHKTAPDGEKLFTPITILALQNNVCLTNAETGAKTLNEFIAYTKANPGKLNIAAFTTSISEVMLRRLVQVAGIQAQVIPSYANGTAMIRSLLANETQFACVAPVGVAEQIKTGRLTALAVTSRERAASFPDVPTVRSLGHDFVYDQWYAIFVRSDTPRDIVTQLRRDFGEVMKIPEVMALVRKGGFDPETRTPDESVAAIAESLKIYKDAIRATNVQPQ